MKNLSNEVKLDIFKYLNFNQLNVIQQTNKSLNEIVDRSKPELARKEVYSMEIEWKYYVCKQVKCESKGWRVKLDEDIKAKWNEAIKKRIPLFFNQPGDNEVNEKCNHGGNCCSHVYNNKNRSDMEKFGYKLDEAINLFVLFKNTDDVKPPKILHLQLKRYPKNIEELFFVRYWLEQLSSCYFENIKIKQAVFNPKIIDLLFDGSPPLQFYTKYFYLFGGYLNATFEFIYHHLKIFEPKGFYFENTEKKMKGEKTMDLETFVKHTESSDDEEEGEGENNNEEEEWGEGEGERAKIVEYIFEGIEDVERRYHVLLVFPIGSKEIDHIFVNG
ncbi:unnamed protein product [Meloidogyne enterolobii]|uniref:Uncharacterized protein n=1 Tax=Meloidogyne enterolobii TaxID=390850 RepID=A0ACB0YTI5_MELEN